jgi:hypothetical protein
MKKIKRCDYGPDIGPGWKGLPRTNGPAYFVKKSFMTLTAPQALERVFFSF